MVNGLILLNVVLGVVNALFGKVELGTFSMSVATLIAVMEILEKTKRRY